MPNYEYPRKVFYGLLRVKKIIYLWFNEALITDGLGKNWVGIELKAEKAHSHYSHKSD